jgi:hypothetical protein
MPNKHLREITFYFLTLTFLLIAPISAQDNRVQLLTGQKIYVNGINVAWNRFAGDVGNQTIDEAWFRSMLDGVKAAGGNSIRWWLFTNATKAPTFGPDGLVTGPGTATIANIKKVLDLAEARGIVISLCLLSFDLFQTQQGMNVSNNQKLMTTDIGIQNFIDQALVPLVNGIGKHKGILCWEIFNEPEGMTELGWTPVKISMHNVQVFVNRAAGAIHRAQPGIPVSNGSWSFIASASGVPGTNKNYYSDKELILAGGDSLGTLDFYMVHYYDWGKEAISPFHHPASYWKMDKAIVIGEFAAKGPYTGINPTQAYNLLYENGYAGGMAWMYTGGDGNGGIAEAKAGMISLKEKHPVELTIVPNYQVGLVHASGARAEKPRWHLVNSIDGRYSRNHGLGSKLTSLLGQQSGSKPQISIENAF